MDHDNALNAKSFSATDGVVDHDNARNAKSFSPTESVVDHDNDSVDDLPHLETTGTSLNPFDEDDDDDAENEM